MLPGITPAIFGGEDYRIARSLRFHYADVNWLSRTPSVTGERRAWTYSGWIKRTLLGNSTGSALYLYEAYLDATNYTIVYLHNAVADTLSVISVTANVTKMQKRTTAVVRDTTAWFHLVVAADTRPATPTCDIYCNGVLATSFLANIVPPQNDLYHFNTAGVIHYLGNHAGNTAFGLSCYLAENYFIDGQALPAAAFGWLDGATNTWRPKKYAGAYGTNGFYIPFTDNSSTAALGKDFTGMSNLLPYSDNFAVWSAGNGAVLTPGIADPLGGAGAYKLAVSGTTASPFVAYSVSVTAGQRATMTVYAKAGEHPDLLIYNGSVNGGYSYFSLATGIVTTSAALGTGSNVVADIQPAGGGWYKCSVTVTYGTTGSESVLPVAATTPAVNGQGLYIYRANLANGSAAPKELQYTNGAAISNKDFAVTGISVTAGVTNDSLVDSPTNYGVDTGLGGQVRGNYCVLNTLARAFGVAHIDGGLTHINAAGTFLGSRGTIGLNYLQNWYFEITVSGLGHSMIGVCKDAFDAADQFGSATNSWTYYQPGTKYGPGAIGVAYGAAYTNGDVIGVHLSNGDLTFYKNGVSQGVAFTGLSGTFFPLSSVHTVGCRHDCNFGQRPFAYAAPTGAKAICSQNMTAVSNPFLPATFVGNANADGPFVYAGGVVETVTINGNVATRGTDFDSLASGMKLRTASASFNAAGTNTITAATFGPPLHHSRAQPNN